MRIASAVLVVCLLVTIGCFGQFKSEAWARLPEDIKTHFISHDYSGDKEFSIMCFPQTLEAWKMLHGDEAEEREAKTINFINITEEEYPGARLLVVAVAPYGNQYWWPWELIFSQAPRQYDIGYDDIIEIADPFDGGQIMAGMQAWGLIIIPPSIDLTQPFRVWMGEDYGEIAAYELAVGGTP